MIKSAFVYLILSAVSLYALTISPQLKSELIREGAWPAFAEKFRQWQAQLAESDQSLPPLSKLGSIQEPGGVQTMKVVVILVDFSDEPAQTGLGPVFFDTLLFGRYDAVPRTFKDFYLENSYDKLLIDGDVFGWFRMPHPYSYYYGTGNGLQTQPNAQTLALDAAVAADPTVNFSAYANVAHGLDGFIVIHAGPGAEEGGQTNMIWSHHWTLPGSGYTSGDGTTIRKYVMGPEMEFGGPTRIGVYCHEFGHELGLPDLYDVGSGGLSGLGDWSLMASGSWNGNGQWPAHLDGWSKLFLNFGDYEMVNSNLANVTFGSTVADSLRYKILLPAASFKEYFVVENRQKTGFDRMLPGAGLLIYHCDDNLSFCSQGSNDVEACGHWHVSVEQADGNFDLENDPSNQGDEGDPYPGPGGTQTVFSNWTSPSSASWYGNPNEVSISGIQQNADSTMSCNLYVSSSAVIHVPADQPTIQAGIDAAVDGDTVLVGPGTYTESLTINGKEVYVISYAGSAYTTIQNSNPILYIHNSGPVVQIRGFTFIGGGSYAIRVEASDSVDVRECEFRNLSSNHILFFSSVGDVYSCAFYPKSACCPVAVYVNYSRVRVVKNLFAFGESQPTVYVTDTSYCDLINNTFYHCQTGTSFQAYSVGEVRNNIFVGLTNYAAHAVVNSTLVVNYCDFRNNTTDFQGDAQSGVGNISEDPLFLDTVAGDFHLQPSSPCIDAGDPNLVYNDPDGTRNDMGAFPCLGLNSPPVITPISDLTRYEGDTVSILVVSSDPDATIPNLTAVNLPANASFVDNGNGTGSFYWPIAPKQYGVFDIMFIASDSVLADTESVTITVLPRLPQIGTIAVAHDTIRTNIVQQVPPIDWKFVDFNNDDPQLKFEIAVGSDSDWTYAEMWNPAPFNSPDTFVVYNGSPLVDGATYWLRLRVNNSLAWSDWKQISFRMNSVPSIPQLRLPPAGGIVASQHPNLVIRNSTDAENDSLYYTFEIFPDTTVEPLLYSFTKTPDADSLTTLVVDSTLIENIRYFWRVKVSDYYEQSDYSETRSFYVNTANTPPTAVTLTAPANSVALPIADLRPTFSWSAATDPDPLDSVTYDLLIAIDSNFTFLQQILNLTATSHTLTTDLLWGKEYWWNVRAADRNGGATWSAQVFTFRTVTLGDANGDGSVDISDAVFLINYIFAGGGAPDPLMGGDANCDGAIDISDAVYLISYIFAGGPAPCAGK